MDMKDWFLYIWSLMTDNGWTVFDTFISFADVFIFVTVGGLFIWLISVLLGGE